MNVLIHGLVSDLGLSQFLIVSHHGRKVVLEGGVHIEDLPVLQIQQPLKPVRLLLSLFIDIRLLFLLLGRSDAVYVPISTWTAIHPSGILVRGITLYFVKFDCNALLTSAEIMSD